MISLQYEVRYDDDVISPNEVAKDVLDDMGRKKDSLELFRTAALYHLREIARAVGRSQQMESESTGERMSGYDDDFQMPRRYPIFRQVDGEWEEVYVLRTYLTRSECLSALQHLRWEAALKQRQAQALEAEVAARDKHDLGAERYCG